MSLDVAILDPPMSALDAAAHAKRVRRRIRHLVQRSQTRHPHVGANIGSFAIWAARRWPGSFIHCYEPLPENFVALEANLGHLPGRVVLNNCAVGDAGRRLFLGRNNCGEASLFDIGEQSLEWVNVETRAPATLPKADILKLDTEGAEVEILSGLPEPSFDVVLLEYHSEENRRTVDRLLQGYILVGGHVRCALKYAPAAF